MCPHVDEYPKLRELSETRGEERVGKEKDATKRDIWAKIRFDSPPSLWYRHKLVLFRV